MALRVLFLGENWFGSCARACCYALRRAGCDVFDMDSQTFIPQWRRRSNRAVRRLMHGRIVREYNDMIVAAAASYEPDILVAFKGTLVEMRTLELLRRRGIALYNYFPDTIPAEHGAELAQSIGHYDCVFYTKKFWATKAPAGLAGRQMMFLPHGYDPEVHRPLPLSPRDVRQFGHDVTVIANHTLHKEELLTALVRHMPDIKLHIYGNGWSEPARAPELRPHISGAPLIGTQYVRAIRAASINLAITSWAGREEIDETTTRTYEIPACEGFMLHERTPELLHLFEEGKEVSAFGSVEELAEKIRYYLSHALERESVARAGHQRCVPAYSYDERVKTILNYHAGRG